MIQARNVGFTQPWAHFVSISHCCPFLLMYFLSPPSQQALSLSLQSLLSHISYSSRGRSPAAATPPTTNITYVTAWKLISSSLPSLVWPLCLLLLSYTYTIHTHPHMIQQGTVDTNCGAHSIRVFSGWGNFNDMENHSHYEEECWWASWRGGRISPCY